MSADLRAVLDGKRTDGKRLSAHIAETAAAPWLDPLGKPYLFESVDECNRSWRSLMEHEAIEVEALEAALAAGIEENERRQQVSSIIWRDWLSAAGCAALEKSWPAMRALGDLVEDGRLSEKSAAWLAALAQEKPGIGCMGRELPE